MKVIIEGFGMVGKSIGTYLLRPIIYAAIAVLMVPVALLQNAGTASADTQVGQACPNPFTDFQIPTPSSNPYTLTNGPDGALWFNDYNKISRITLTGEISEFNLPGVNGPNTLHQMVSGPDGTVWFASSNTIRSVTPSGVFSVVHTFDGQAGVGFLTAGQNGDIWFSLYQDDQEKIGRISPSGDVVTFPMPIDPDDAVLRPTVSALAWGNDGAVWFGYESGSITYPDGSMQTVGKIGRMSTDGQFTYYPVYKNTPNRGIASIAAGADGKMWFSEAAVHKIATIDASGEMVEHGLDSNIAPLSITRGADGNMWFTSDNSISRVTADPFHVDSFFGSSSVPNYGYVMRQLVSGPDGALWSEDQQNGRIVRLPIIDPPFQSQATNLVSPGVTQQPVLSWGAVAGMNHYNICRDGVSVGSSPAPSFTDPNAPEGYHAYSVTTVDSAGNESFQSWMTDALVDRTAPAISNTNWSVNPLAAGQTTTMLPRASDALAGVESFTYSLDGGEFTAIPRNRSGRNVLTYSSGLGVPTDLPDGTHTIILEATDGADNVSTVTTQLVVGNPAPAAPANLAATSPTNNPVLTWNAVTDADHYDIYRDGAVVGTSTSTTYADASATDGGHDYYVKAVNAGGMVSDPSNTVTVLVDKVIPTITYVVAPAANANGWNDTNATVTFTCQDAQSGIASCTIPQNVTAETSSQTVTGTATDNAGNSASLSVTVKLDKTKPTLGTPTITPSASKTLTQTRTLTTSATDPNAANGATASGIWKGEYYYGTDPGAGSGTAMTLTGNNLTATLGTTMPAGSYLIYVRTQDKAGNWSDAKSVRLNVTGAGFTTVNTNGTQNFTPSLAGGDVLPHLATNGQTDPVMYALNVGYGTNGLNAGNSFSLTYTTGGFFCWLGLPGANCHTTTVANASITSLTFDGTNRSHATIRGTATVTLDGATTTNPVVIEAVDGNRVNGTTQDHYTMKVYAVGSNPDTATPLYQVSDNVARTQISFQ